MAAGFLMLCLKGMSQSYNELVERAMTYTFKDSLQQAEHLFKQALKVDPANARNALVFSNLGTIQKRMGKTDEALESYTLALNITPYSSAMLLNRAALYMDKNLTDKAYLDYCKVIDLLPKDREARLMRAYIYMKRRQYNDAYIDYQVILDQDAKDKSALLGLAMLEQKEGKYVAAGNRLNLLIEDYPKDASLYKMRANIELDQNLPDAALLDLQQAVSIDSGDRDAYVQIGDLLLQSGKKTDARRAYEEAVRLGVPRSQLLEKLRSCGK